MKISARCLLLVVIAVMMQACTSTIETYHPGYYQEGRYHNGGYYPAYYDVYGNFHPPLSEGSYYQEGRWHRAYITTTTARYQLTRRAKAAAVGAVAGAVVGGIAAGGDLGTIGVASAVGAGIGAITVGHETHSEDGNL